MARPTVKAHLYGPLTKTQQELVQQWIHLPKHVVGKMPRAASSYADRDDALAHAYYGLVMAAQRFDPTKGFCFSTYAYWCIHNHILRGLKANEKMIGVDVTEPEHDYERSRTWTPTPTSDHTGAAANRLDVAEMMRHIDCAGRLVLRMHAEGYTNQEIGQYLSITRERVRQIKNRAIDRIRGKASA